MTEEKRKPLSVVSKLCYGLGNIGNETMWTIFGAYCSLFLVQVAQMPPLLATSVIFGSRAVDVLCNFILGPLIDRTNTRWGKTKPWLAGSGLPLTAVTVLIWYVPDVGTDGKLAWYILMCAVMMLCMSGNSISHKTLAMFLSEDSQDRESAIMYRSVLALGGIVGGVAMHGQILASYRRSEYNPCANNTNSSFNTASRERVETGYLVSAGAVSSVCLVCVIAAILGTTERSDISATSGEQGRRSLLRTIKTVLTFRPNVFLCLSYFFAQVAMSIVHGTAALYVEYSLDLVDHVETVLLAFVASTAFFLPVTGVVVSKFGKRIPCILYEAVSIPLYIGTQFVPTGSLAVYAIAILMGCTSTAMHYIPWTMLSDVIEDCYLKTGERLDTAFVAVILSVQSFGMTVGLILATIGLEITGYKLGSCVQPESVGSAMRILMSAFGASATVLCILFIWKYPINEERQSEVTEAIGNRKCSGAVEDEVMRRNGSLLDMKREVLHLDDRAGTTSHLMEDKLISSEVDLTLLLDCRESIV